jgi:4'-phosphopantetheinyl transferase
MVKLYYAKITNLYDEKCFEEKIKQVKEKRQVRIFEYCQKKDRCRSLAASLLLKMALEREGICYDEVCFAQKTGGKPYLLLQSGLFFSLAHAQEMAVCVIADQEVGVDVERKDRLTGKKEEQKLKIAKKMLTPEEWKQWEKEEYRTETLISIWTKKESYVKMTGKGLTEKLMTIDTLSNAFYQQMLLDDMYILSVCTALVDEGGVRIENMSNYL